MSVQTQPRHPLAVQLNWYPGVDYPSAPEANTLEYLHTMRSNYVNVTAGETPRDLYMRLAKTAANYKKHLNIENLEEKFFSILWELIFVPATPVATNFGNDRGLPISCFGGTVADSMWDINLKSTEMSMLSKYGGGTSYDFSAVRPIGSPIKNGQNGHSDGIIPFMHRFDSVIRDSKQGQTRRGAVALYLSSDHKELESFLRIRKHEGAVELQCHNVNHGVIFDDEFMLKVKNGDPEARKIYQEVMVTRVERGQPYMLYKGNMNKNLPDAFKIHKLVNTTSNLCTEIFLPTDADHTFVCCISSLNALKFDLWEQYDAVFLATLFLDAVLQEFLDKAKAFPNGIESAIRFAEKSRALGLGVMGLHDFFFSKRLPFTSLPARAYNKKIFAFLQKESIRASVFMYESGEPQPEWCVGTNRNNLTNNAVAPNRSSSKLGGGVAEGIQPKAANAYIDKDAKGAYVRSSTFLDALFDEKGFSAEQKAALWESIAERDGSVQHLAELTPEEREVFLTFSEINQLHLVEMAGDRQPFIDQGQSLNLHFDHDAPVDFVTYVHYRAWELGLKSLYYYRGESVLTADSASTTTSVNTVSNRYDTECEACSG